MSGAERFRRCGGPPAKDGFSPGVPLPYNTNAKRQPWQLAWGRRNLPSYLRSENSELKRLSRDWLSKPLILLVENNYPQPLKTTQSPPC
jgi:hypothetical protein